MSGAIFTGDLDTTHPLGFGYDKRSVTLFRNHTRVMEVSKDPYATVIQYHDEPLLSGYASEKSQKAIAGTASIISRGVGRGSVTCMMDTPNFRGFWYGSNKLLLNGLFFNVAFSSR